MALDEMPILDRAASVSGLYFALGFSGGGFSLHRGLAKPWPNSSSIEKFLPNSNASI